MQINMHEAKSQLSKLGERAWKGETIIISKAGKPYLELRAYSKPSTPRIPGKYKDQFQLYGEFSETDHDIENFFEGSEG